MSTPDAALPPMHLPDVTTPVEIEAGPFNPAFMLPEYLGNVSLRAQMDEVRGLADTTYNDAPPAHEAEEVLAALDGALVNLLTHMNYFGFNVMSNLRGEVNLTGDVGLVIREPVIRSSRLEELRDYRVGKGQYEGMNWSWLHLPRAAIERVVTHPGGTKRIPRYDYRGEEVEPLWWNCNPELRFKIIPPNFQQPKVFGINKSQEVFAPAGRWHNLFVSNVELYLLADGMQLDPHYDQQPTEVKSSD